MASEITKAIQYICTEKGLAYETVLDALETALAAAYRKDFGNRQQNIKMKFDPETGDMQAWDEKEVVEDITPEELEQAQEELAKRREDAHTTGRELTEEEMADLVRFNPKNHIMITEAKIHKTNASIGEIIKIKLTIPTAFGRMAAQTAKQVIIQKLREAERNTVFEDFKGQEGVIVQGTVQRRDRNGSIIIDLGKITGIIPAEEQITREPYRPGMRLKILLLSISQGMRGPEIILSRASKKMVESVFKQEIPEIADGVVEIKGIARDPGNRSKVAVFTSDQGVDPIGSCIGQRGSRITTIIDELGGEKIDIIQFSTNTSDYVKQALSPAKIASVTLFDATREATAHVVPDQFSLAIGRGGQNVRLAAALTGWKIKVVEEGGDGQALSSEDALKLEEQTPEPSKPQEAPNEKAPE